jgi:hypothetical protein
LTVTYRPVEPARLPDLLAERLDRAERPGRALRVAVDGPHCADPLPLAESLVTPLRARGRPTCVIAADTFWRDASLRLEFGRADVESFAGWLDDEALRREVLDPLGPNGSGSYLPSLRDPQTNRATREAAHTADDGEIVIIGGELMLGRGLPFDVGIHLSMSPAGRERRTDADRQWTLPAFERYDAEVRPAETADVVVRVDDPRHPAVVTRAPLHLDH